MSNIKKSDNKKFKIYLDGNFVDNIKEFFEQYKGFKFSKKQKRIAGVIALACTCGLVTVSGIKHSNDSKTDTSTYEDVFKGEPIPDEYMQEYQNQIVNSNMINDKKVEVIQNNTKYQEPIEEEKNNFLDVNLGSLYEGFRYKLSDEELEPFFRYADMYGVDPYMVLALAAKESSLRHRALIPGGSSYREGNSVGICQISIIPNWSVSAKNMYTGNMDTLDLTLNNISNYELNIKASCMIMQNSLNTFYGNPYLTFQSHNYSEGSVNIAVNCYAEELGITPEEVMLNTKDCGWIKYIQDIHENPNKYFKWDSEYYGDDKYIYGTLEDYCPDNGFISHYYVNEEPYTFNFTTGELTYDNQTTLTR